MEQRKPSDRMDAAAETLHRQNGKRMNKYLYLAVSSDRYELPYAVADSVEQLSRMIGVNKKTIWSHIGHAQKRKWKRHKYMRIEIDETEEET